MNYYIEKENKIVLFDESKERLEQTLEFLPQYAGLEIKETDRPIVDFKFADMEEWQAEQARKERERLDKLSLTPADVERALYTAKGMDFDDLIEFISQTYSPLEGESKSLISERGNTTAELDIKALKIEFRAKDFYRGASLADGTRLFDVIGALLGYTPEDMDYLFENKTLPVKTTEETETDDEKSETAPEEAEIPEALPGDNTENDEPPPDTEDTEEDTLEEKEE